MGLNEVFLLGKNLKKFRLDMGLNQKEVAKALNINQSTYSRYENNQAEPTEEEMNRMCAFFEISKYDLIVDETRAAQHGFITPMGRLNSLSLAGLSSATDLRENSSILLLLEAQKLNEKGILKLLYTARELVENEEYLYIGEDFYEHQQRLKKLRNEKALKIKLERKSEERSMPYSELSEMSKTFIDKDDRIGGNRKLIVEEMSVEEVERIKASQEKQHVKIAQDEIL